VDQIAVLAPENFVVSFVRSFVGFIGKPVSTAMEDKCRERSRKVRHKACDRLERPCIMRLYVIGDEDTVVGFQMAGVQGTAVENRDQAAAALREAEEREDALLIIADQVAEWLREDIDRIRYGAERPLIVEVPGPRGPSEEIPSLFRLIREAVGIKFET
jgi:V/A-type H+-transporting ATPase subunit F